MAERPRKQAKSTARCSSEVSSSEWDFIKMAEQEEDLINRMYRLVGNSSLSMDIWLLRVKVSAYKTGYFVQGRNRK
ncbi:hypothetical protein RCOM_1691440 [Ricinus communis]|uniref:Uncharacterized protein n=1 Tax=Ricinus communis TaxID=3988 RepID=B9RCQ8_RICCO|nr:hypothetical protein RCOM_1691440 [Ricinus communis]